MVVEERVNIRFIVRVMLKGWLSNMVMFVIRVVVNVNWRLFNFISFDFIVYSEWGFSFSLIKNSIMIILNLVKCWMVIVLLLIRLNIGLIISFVIK